VNGTATSLGGGGCGRRKRRREEHGPQPFALPNTHKCLRVDMCTPMEICVAEFQGVRSRPLLSDGGRRGIFFNLNPELQSDVNSSNMAKSFQNEFLGVGAACQ